MSSLGFAVVCILAFTVDAARIDAFRVFRDALRDDERRNLKTDLQDVDVLRVRVNVAKLPPGRKNPQPKVEIRIAARKYRTDPGFLAHNARFQIPLAKGDGSLYLTLYDGRRKLATVKKLLRRDIFPSPGKWLSFNETLKKGNGQLQFDVFYEKSRQGDTGSEVLDADYQPIDTNVTVDNTSSTTVFQVCQMLQSSSYDALHSAWAHKDRPDLSFYFLCNPLINNMEVCFFSKNLIEIQLCRMSAIHFSLTKTHLQSNGGFSIPLDGAVLATGRKSTLSGTVSGDSIKDNQLYLQSKSGQSIYTFDPVVAARIRDSAVTENSHEDVMGIGNKSTQEFDFGPFPDFGH